MFSKILHWILRDERVKKTSVKMAALPVLAIVLCYTAAGHNLCVVSSVCFLSGTHSAMFLTLLSRGGKEN